jgi:hypothetical protein
VPSLHSAFYTDPDLGLSEHPGLITPAALARSRQLVQGQWTDMVDAGSHDQGSSCKVSGRDTGDGSRGVFTGQDLHSLICNHHHSLGPEHFLTLADGVAQAVQDDHTMARWFGELVTAPKRERLEGYPLPLWALMDGTDHVVFQGLWRPKVYPMYLVWKDLYDKSVSHGLCRAEDGQEACDWMLPYL